MADKKNLCAPISAELHARVREELDRLGITLGPYMEQVLNEHFEGGKSQMNNSKTRTMAFQVPEELFQRIKKYLAAHGGLSQKDFIIGLVEDALQEWEDENAADEGSTTAANEE